MKQVHKKCAVIPNKYLREIFSEYVQLFMCIHYSHSRKRGRIQCGFLISKYSDTSTSEDNSFQNHIR